MAHGNHDTGLSWEWDSVLLLSNTPLFPSSEADRSQSGDLRDSLILTSFSSSDHYDQRDKLDTRDSFTNHVDTDSHKSDARNKGSSGDKRGDPRLDCPNFLAGRVPCACTDNDDDDIGVSRKRSKPVPRCQVATCGAELTDLKGYHQRHRVCLRCAHATRVILREQPHRYCQQCGKFHPICDFDEGKRSCRRKLERHNNRRRRKAGEDGLSALDGGDTDTQNENSPGEGTGNHIKFDLFGEGEPKESAGEKPSLHVEEAVQTPGISSNENLSVTVGVPQISTLPEACDNISLQLLEPCETPRLEENVPTSEILANCREVSQPLEHQFEEEQACSLARQVPFSVEHADHLHIVCPEDFGLHGSAHAEVVGRDARMRRGHDDESLLALLMEENCETEGFRLSENSSGHLTSNPTQLWESSRSPRLLQSKQAAYSSSLPTGRISFKLYDWNPGDFPRQLRQQVMNWLSNMPVDLEGYIRSGCTILTIFIAMPQQGWDKLNADWAGSVLKLVKAERGQFRFWSSGYLVARMNDHEVHIKDGEVEQTLSKTLGNPPVLHSVHPLCLEAGCEDKVVIHGQNFNIPHSRLLVSFGGKYIINGTCQSHMQGGKKGISSEVNEAELLVSMPALHSRQHGTAYIEVSHVSGTSNFIPLLVAEKKIVDEVRSLEEEIRRPTSCCSPYRDGSADFPLLSQRIVHSLLLDLGWVLKNVSLTKVESGFQVELLELHLERLQRLLFFAIKRSWYSVVERVLQLASRAGLMEKVGILENGLSAVQVALLHHQVAMVDHLISCAESLCVSSQSEFWWKLNFPGPKGLTALHMISLQPGAQHLQESLLKEKGIASMWNSVQDNCGWTPQDYATQGDENGSRIEISDSLSHDEYDTRTEDLSSISRDFTEFHCEDLLSSRFEGETSIFLPSLLYPKGKTRRSQKVAIMTIVGFTRRRLPSLLRICGYEGLNMHISSRKKSFQLLSSVTILLVCAGLCVMLQRPHQVVLLPLSLRQCLWGLADGPR